MSWRFLVAGFLVLAVLPATSCLFRPLGTGSDGGDGDADGDADADADGDGDADADADTDEWPTCGDSACEGEETPSTCPDDCPFSCGNGVCDGVETALTCPGDCSASCEDGFCTHGESAAACPEDCPASCGDGSCTHDETAASCPSDCPANCGDDACTHEETAGSCPIDCPASCGDGFCTHGETSSTCLADCPASCDNGACDDGESAASCPSDCEALCGDGACTHGETAGGCPGDCSAVCSDGLCTHTEAAAICPDDCPAVCGDDAVTHTEECDGVTSRICTTTCGSAGAQTCSSCRWGSCTPPSEACNGVDDDCDGVIDRGAGCPCDLQWQGDHAYLFCTAGTTWDEARTSCVEVGYDLGVLDSSAEQTWVWTQTSARVSNDWWSGLTDRAVDGDYTWVDGTTVWTGGRWGAAVGYTYFRDGYPDGSGPCVELDLETTGAWNDTPCDQVNPFVCETTP